MTEERTFNRAAFFRAVQSRRPDAPLVGKDAGFAGYQRAAGNFLEGAAGVVGDIAEGGGIIQQGIGQAAQALAKKSSLLSVLDPIGKHIEIQGALVRKVGQVGKALIESATVEPEGRPAGGVQEFLTEDVARGAGSTLPFLGVGALGGAVGAPAASLFGGKVKLDLLTASAGALAGAAQEFLSAEANGSDDLEKWVSFAGGAVAGSTDALPIGTMLQRMNKASGGRVRRMLVDRLIEGGEEAVQEIFQGFSSNALAKYVRDEDVELSEGLLRAGGAGAATALLFGVAEVGRRGQTAPSDGPSQGSVDPSEGVAGGAPITGEEASVLTGGNSVAPRQAPLEGQVEQGRAAEVTRLRTGEPSPDLGAVPEALARGPLAAPGSPDSTPTPGPAQRALPGGPVETRDDLVEALASGRTDIPLEAFRRFPGAIQEGLELRAVRPAEEPVAPEAEPEGVAPAEVGPDPTGKAVPSRGDRNRALADFVEGIAPRAEAEEARRALQEGYLGPDSVVDGRRVAGFTDSPKEAEFARDQGLAVESFGKWHVYSKEAGGGDALAEHLKRHGYGKTTEQKVRLSELAGYPPSSIEAFREFLESSADAAPADVGPAEAPQGGTEVEGVSPEVVASEAPQTLPQEEGGGVPVRIPLATPARDPRGRRKQAASGDLGFQEYVRSLGGLRHQGDLERFTNKEADTKGRRPIVRRPGDGGVSLDALGEQAAELGFFRERPSESELLDALELNIGLLDAEAAYQESLDRALERTEAVARVIGQIETHLEAVGFTPEELAEESYGGLTVAEAIVDRGLDGLDPEEALERLRSADLDVNDEVFQLFAFAPDVAGDVKDILGALKARLVRTPPVSRDGVNPSTGMVERLIATWQDAMRPLKTFQAEVAGGEQLEDSTDAYLQEELRRGRTKERLDRIRDTYAVPIGKTLHRAKLTQEEVGEFLMARHAAERNAVIRKRSGALEEKKAADKANRGYANAFSAAERALKKAEVERKSAASAIEKVLRRFTSAMPDSRKAILRETERALIRSSAAMDRARVRLETALAAPEILTGSKAGRSLVTRARKAYASKRAEVARLDRERIQILRRLSREAKDPAAVAAQAATEELEKLTERIGNRMDGIESTLASKEAKISSTLHEELGKVQRNDAGSGLTDREAAEILLRVQADPRRQGFERVASLIDRMNAETRKGWVADGLMTQETVDGLEKAYTYYVPLRTDLDDHEGGGLKGTGRGVDTRGEAFRGATGRSTRADARNVIAYALTQSHQAAVRGEKNLVARTFADFVKAHEDLLGDAFTEEIITTRPQVVDGFVRQVYDPRVKLADNVLGYRRDGEQVWLQAKPEWTPVIRAMKALGADSGGKVTRVVGQITRQLAGLSTRNNPVFPLFNLIRDVGGSFATSAEFGLRFAASVVSPSSLSKSMASLTRSARGKDPKDGTWDDYLADYKEDGAPVSFLNLEDITAQVREIDAVVRREARQGRKGSVIRGWENMMGVVEAANDVIENATRFSFYVHARTELGWSRQRAASGAKNLTTNFERKGELGAVMNAWYMFSNAGIQGTARVAQAVRTPGVQKLLAGAVVGSAIWDSLMRALGGEDDDGQAYWDKITGREKRTNFIVMIPGTDGERVTVPVPFVYNWFQTLGQELGAVMTGNRKPSAAVAEIAAAAIDATNPIGGSIDLAPAGISQALAPTLTEPILQLATNRDFAGRPIKYAYGDGPSSHPSFTRASDASQAVVKWLNSASGGDPFKAGSLDVAPETLDHLAKFATGGLGAFIGRMADIPTKSAAGDLTLRDVPLVRRLYREPSAFASHKDLKDLRSGLTAEKKRAELAKRAPSAALIGLLGEAKRVDKDRKDTLDRLEGATPEKRKKDLEALDTRVQRFNLRARKYLLAAND